LAQDCRKSEICIVLRLS